MNSVKIKTKTSVNISKYTLLVIPPLLNLILYILGDQGKGWKAASVQLPDGSLSLVFEAVRGDGFKGDIAIDDVSYHGSEYCFDNGVYARGIQ